MKKTNDREDPPYKLHKLKQDIGKRLYEKLTPQQKKFMSKTAGMIKGDVNTKTIKERVEEIWDKSTNKYCHDCRSVGKNTECEGCDEDKREAVDRIMELIEYEITTS